jgi:hypothetical protein
VRRRDFHTKSGIASNHAFADVSKGDHKGKTMLKLVEGGRSNPVHNDRTGSGLDEIKSEGLRRLKASGFERYAAREKLTGTAMPTELKVFSLQIEFAIGALSTLDPIPNDYARDGYWPSYGGTPVEAVRRR